MSKNEVIKNAIWEIDRICKITSRSKDWDEIQDMLDDLEELQDLIAEHEERLIHAVGRFHQELDRDEEDDDHD